MPTPAVPTLPASPARRVAVPTACAPRAVKRAWRVDASWPGLAVLVLVLVLAGGAAGAADEAKGVATAPPALSVTLVQPQRTTLTTRIAAGGSVAAWQEAIVGAEASGLRITELRAGVGDSVRKGQVLARFSSDLVQAEAAQARAALAESQALLAAARADAQRARDLQPSGALSAQQINQYLTAERTAEARLQAQQALARTQQLRLAQTQLLAPDAGVVAARNATVGAVVQAGAELFRLVRQGRLEWRAEVGAAEMAQIRPGQTVRVTPNGGSPITGRVRVVAPTVDPATRNGLVYVDLPSMTAAGNGGARAGVYARGEFETGSGSVLTLPQSAVLLRDGFQVVLRVGADQRVVQTKVAVGQRSGDRVEITGGLPADARVVASGGAFLADGDTVRVVAAPPAPAVPAAAAGTGAAKPVAAAVPAAPRPAAPRPAASR